MRKLPYMKVAKKKPLLRIEHRIIQQTRNAGCYTLVEGDLEDDGKGFDQPSSTRVWKVYDVKSGRVLGSYYPLRKTYLLSNLHPTRTRIEPEEFLTLIKNLKDSL